MGVTHMPYTPGVDEAIMSRYAVLTPAAWQDFAAYVQRLEAGGHHGRARALASSVVEIRHAGHGLPGRVCRGTASLLGAATHPLGAIPGGRVPPFVFPGLGCGVVGIVLRCLAQPRLKRGLLTMAALRRWSGLVSSGWRYQLQRRGPSLSATTSALTSTSPAPVPRSAWQSAAWNGRPTAAGDAEPPCAGTVRREDAGCAGSLARAIGLGLAMAYSQEQGRYAVEAAGESHDARTIQEQAGLQRAHNYRAAHGLQHEDDLAYAFSHLEDAQQAGGQTLSQMWVEARRSAEGRLLLAVSAAVERYAVLIPAAWRDFAAYVQQLETQQGHHGRASTLAGSVEEIRHAGHGLPGGSAGVLRPSPLPSSSGCHSGAADAARDAVGSGFPG